MRKEMNGWILETSITQGSKEYQRLQADDYIIVQYEGGGFVTMGRRKMDRHVRRAINHIATSIHAWEADAVSDALKPLGFLPLPETKTDD